MFEIISAHPAVVSIAGYWIFSAVVGGMPEPTPASSAGYTWLHNSLHILAGNLQTAVSAKFPTAAAAAGLPAGSAIEHKETTVVVTPQP